MKTIKKIFFTTLLASISTHVFASNGMINSGELFKSHPMFKDIETELLEYLDLSQKKIQKNSSLIDAQQIELNNSVKKIGVNAAKIKQKEIDSKRKLIDDQKKILQQKLNTYQEKGRQKVLEDIMINAEKVRQKHNFDMIIDSGSVIAINADLEVNKEVLDSIKENYKPQTQPFIDELEILRADK